MGGPAGGPGLLPVGDWPGRKRVSHRQPLLRSAQRHGGRPAGPPEDPPVRRSLDRDLQSVDGFCAEPVHHLPCHGAERAGYDHVFRHLHSPCLRQPEDRGPRGRVHPSLRQQFPDFHAGQRHRFAGQPFEALPRLCGLLPAERCVRGRFHRRPCADGGAHRHQGTGQPGKADPPRAARPVHQTGAQRPEHPAHHAAGGQAHRFQRRRLGAQLPDQNVLAAAAH